MSSETNWDLLPNQPLEFFGLKAGFDRKELKRAYGAKIKQFKPETHPAEFQRIREAYEVLESQQRYGVQQAVFAKKASAWDVVTEPVKKTPTRKPASRTDSDFAEALPAETATQESAFETAHVAPRETYERLAKSAGRSPQDYFVLATLADLVDSKSDNMYLKWLLTGVKEYPSDPGLLRLLTEYLSAFASIEIASSTLFTLSKLVEGGDYYRVTEKLWERLITDADFAQFNKTLNACEANLKHRTLRPKLAFTIRLLRFAVWKAQPEWIDERLKFIEQHGSELDASLDEEIEFVQMLRDYVREDRAELLKRPLGSTIDRMINAYCCDSSTRGIAEVAAVCDTLARNSHGLMQTFPIKSEETQQRVLSLCNIIAYETSNSTGLDFGRVKAGLMERQADAAISDFAKSLADIAGKLNWMQWRTYGIPLVALWLGPIILASGFSYFGIFFLFWSLLAPTIFLGALRPLFLDKHVNKKSTELVIREYEAQWRPRLFRYVQACHAPASDAIQQLMESGVQIGQKQIVEIVLSYAFGDNTLRLFSNLQLFVH